ncbi:glycosyl hydrolase family 79 C-terminal domain-containing protein [Chitinophaga vietnamensis]|uniref:glycosyl hydrolase family 79 C-terminal domain-containing protein n=1 Tax=Chitinophaga vietnamensis TaxID=2593957 RepID=UPI001178867A|nr:glycosyl hydrolase family 79 C-terminal domain-containing protein [Chitinophaga vietnamensis]
MRHICLLPLLLLLTTACNKKSDNLSSSPQPKGTPVTVIVHPDGNGIPVPASFAGFSYEAGALPDSTFLTPSNTVLIQLIRNLGNGVLRVGGNSSDRLVWTGAPRTAATGKDSLTTTDIDRFAAFAKATGWPVLFGLNLGVYNPQKAAAEAGYVSNALGGSLQAFQTGNEPDLFSRNGHRDPTYQYSNYQTEWMQYFQSVRNALPASPFAGPDVAYRTNWISAFATAAHNNVKLIDGHYYRTGPASDSSITYHTILAPDTKLPAYLNALYNSAQPYSLPYRLSECNSVYDGGKKGVSDIFAAALWALDYMWTVAKYNGQGVNFHGGQGGAYTPIAMSNGVAVARPEYYALLAFHQAAHGSIVPADVNAAQLNTSVYVCKDGATEYITLINKEDNQDISFTITPGMQASTAQAFTLTAPSITATDGVTFAGSQPDANGRFTPGNPPAYGPSNNQFIVNVPAGSAAVVVIK